MFECFLQRSSANPLFKHALTPSTTLDRLLDELIIFSQNLHLAFLYLHLSRDILGVSQELLL